MHKDFNHNCKCFNCIMVGVNMYHFVDTKIVFTKSKMVISTMSIHLFTLFLVSRYLPITERKGIYICNVLHRQL